MKDLIQTEKHIEKNYGRKLIIFHKRLEEIQLQTTSTSQIIPIIIGDEKRAMDFSKFLKSKGIFAQAIRYPTVKKDSS